MVKIRLRRDGAKKSPYYTMVVADSRYPADGRFIEKVGTYNPMTEPVTLNVDKDKVLDWIKKGAKPTDTAMALIKKAAAITNYKAGLLDYDKAKAICSAAEEVIKGYFKDDFIVDAVQGGAGTSANMNMNEVIANRANELLGGKLGYYDKVHPNDHVNMAQSTNDVIPTAGKMTVIRLMQPLTDELRLSPPPVFLF